MHDPTRSRVTNIHSFNTERRAPAPVNIRTDCALGDWRLDCAREIEAWMRDPVARVKNLGREVMLQARVVRLCASQVPLALRLRGPYLKRLPTNTTQGGSQCPQAQHRAANGQYWPPAAFKGIRNFFGKHPLISGHFGPVREPQWKRPTI